MSSPEETVREQDKAQRLEKEKVILSTAHDLTNGDAGNHKKTGEVLHWIVERTIEQGQLLREIVDADYQTKTRCSEHREACEEHRQPKTWLVKVFGVQYAAPVTVAIPVVSWLVFMFCRKQGWM